MTVLMQKDQVPKMAETTRLSVKPKKKSTAQNNKDSTKIDSMERLKSLSKYFSQLIDTIPPKIYFNAHEEILENIEFNKKVKFEDSTLSKKSKNKRIKLDLNSQQTVSDIASAYYDKKKNNSKVNELRKKLAKRIKALREARGVTDEPKQKASNKKQKQNPDNQENGEKPTDNLPRILDKEGKLVFSKFDFATHVDLAAEKELEKSKQKKKSLKGLLIKAKKEDDKIAKLESVNSDVATKLKERKMWKSALEKCEGNKIRDDPKLIEKTLKQKKKIKVKRAKAWEERKKSVEKRIQMKQDKRQKHIDERKQRKKDKKTKLMKKKGRILN